METVVKDERFAHITKDPRFRPPKRKDQKVKIDKRFQGMFKNKNFKMKYSVDKRGRPIQATTNENLRKFYDLSDSDEDIEVEVEKPKSTKSVKKGDTKSPKVDEKKTKKRENKSLSVPDSDEGQSDIHSNKTNKKEDQPKNVLKPKSPGLKKKEKEKNEKESINENKKEVKDGPKKGVKDKKMKKLQKEDPSSDEDEDLEEEDDDNDDSDDDEEVEKEGDSDDSDDSDDDESEDEELNVKSGPDYARGEGLVFSSSEDDEEEESEEEEDEEESEKEDDVEHSWGEMDREAPHVEESTPRLAVCNMDWDRIKANDLMVLFNSFVPAGGVIKSVTIYPSEYGLERMKEEDRVGPPELVKPLNGKQDETQEEEFHREQLRKYQLNRLRYYYAVLECDSVDTADKIYSECDGMEYESSSTRMDLRFIPDGMEFDQKPKSRVTKMPDSTTYKPSLFCTTALQQSKVDLTWDETDKDRVAMTTKKFTKDDLEQLDVKDYLASSSEGEEDPYAGLEEPEFGDFKSDDEDKNNHAKDGDDESDDEKSIKKYKDLIKGLRDEDEEKEKKDTELEITWEPGLKDTTEDLVKQKKKKEDMSVWDQYLDKKREKNRKKREDKETKKTKTKDSSSEDEDEDSGSDDAGSKDDEGMSDDEIPSDVDMNDPYFKEELDKVKSSEPSEQDLKKKKKGKKKKEKLTPEEEEKKKQREAELALLMMDEDDNKQHFNLKSIMEEGNDKKKKKKLRKRKLNPEDQVQDSFQMNVADPRFSSLYSNAAYNIDPSAPEYKKTKAMTALVEEKFKRRKTKGSDHKIDKNSDKNTSEKIHKKNKSNLSDSSDNKNSSLAALVKSVKAKTKTLQQNKKIRH